MTDCNVRVGRFALTKGYEQSLFGGEIYELQKVTAKTALTAGKFPHQIWLRDVIAVFDLRTDAERLRDDLAGIQGEMKRRIFAAEQSSHAAAIAAIARATTASKEGE